MQGLGKFNNVPKEVIPHGTILHILPKPFYEIQMRTISRQPNYFQPTTIPVAKLLYRLSIMYLKIIQNQINFPATILFHQIFHELQKFYRSFASKNSISNSSRLIIQCSENMDFLIPQSRLNRKRLPPSMPTRPQNRVQMNIALIPIQQNPPSGQSFLKPLQMAFFYRIKGQD